ncbi:PIN domain-containing protein [Candidatus Woesearchaeota archaeon]|nr:PIN domain-containing protein [Candidatus Woesearchaeota archaeon]
MEQINIQNIDKIVPDTSVIIEGLLSEKVSNDHIKSKEIIIHEAVIAELEHQANMGKAIGFLGLDEIKRIKKLSLQKGFELSFKGSRPKAAEIRHASLGEIDSMIRQLAFDEDATLITSDKVQSEVALAKGMKVIYYRRPEKGLRKLKLERFFDETTMSVHLRENVPPYAKKGMPGNWEFKELRKALLKQDEIQDISREIIEDAKLRKDGFIEIERPGSTIVQLGSFRIVITKPPFSDGWEITAVRPVKKLNLNDYKLSEKLMDRVAKQAEGVLVAGAPGMGKCHGKGTPILMYDGSIKMVEDLKNGDLIMGPDSKPRKVFGTALGYGKLYRIVPVKGDPYIVNEYHILSLKYKAKKIERTINISVKNFLELPEHIKERCKGYRTGIEFDKRGVPLNPYFLGLWLGDGLSASLRISNCEIEVISFLEDYAQENGLVLKQHSNYSGPCQTYGITNGHRGGIVINPLLNKMKSLGILNNKHVPDIYKINDYETRMELLAGLIDTDGYLWANCFEIATKYERLKEDILYLARSLGFAAYSKEKFVKSNKYHRIRIAGDISKIPTRIKRKRGSPRQQIKNVLRTGIILEPIGDGEYFGFELDKDGLYCLGDFTVTHNTTFAQALAEYYASQDKIVKTVEAPRDLILPERITQYAISLGDAQEIHDILLLSRPDYTIFDEMRNTDDFKLFADLRLAGVGMVGVVHATSPVDAIQRFIGRVEMGVIPQVIDTVIFIKNGFIQKVLALKMTVKVPSGMTEADLARPVVVINDFETGKLEYEIYSYGEQTVVIPVQAGKEKTASHKLAETAILAEFQKYSRNPEVEMVSDNKCIVYVAEGDIARIIGKQGETINKIEQRLGLSIDVKSLNEKYGSVKGTAKENKEVPFEINFKKNQLLIEMGMDMQNRDVDIYANEEFILSAKAGKTGTIKIKKSNNIGRRLMEALSRKEKLRLVI